MPLIKSESLIMHAAYRFKMKQKSYINDLRKVVQQLKVVNNYFKWYTDIVPGADVKGFFYQLLFTITIFSL